MPSAAALLPHLDDYWRDQLTNRHIDKYSFILTSYPPNSPLRARPDWRQASGPPGGDLEVIRRQALDPFGTRLAICNVLHGAIALFNEDMAAALCAAVNDWMAEELLDREPRLRASILVPMHDPGARGRGDRARGAAIAVSCRCCCSRWARCCSGGGSIGRSTRPPRSIGLAIGIHAGSSYHHAPTLVGLAGPSARGLRRAVGRVRIAAAQLSRRRRVPEIPKLKLVLIESASPGCRPCCGEPTKPGAACAPRCHGSTGRRQKSCASRCG